MTDTSPPRLQQAGWAFVDYRHYCLIASGAGNPDPPDDPTAMLSNEADEGSVYVTTSMHTGRIWLTVHVSAQTSRPRTEMWDHVEESEIVLDEEVGRIQLLTSDGEPVGRFEDLAVFGAGTYRVRVSTRRRSTPPAPLEGEWTYQLDDGGFEEHLIELWSDSSPESLP